MMYYLYCENAVYGLDMSCMPRCACICEPDEGGYAVYDMALHALQEAKRVVQKNSLGFPLDNVNESLDLLNRIAIVPEDDERILSLIKPGT